MRSDSLPSMVTEVLQKEAALLCYLNTRADRYYFSKIPNLNRMILDKKELYHDTYEEELERIIKKEAGKYLRTYIWPDASRGDMIPDNRDLKLLILHPEEGSEQIPTWIERKGSSFREYKNPLFFALADPAGFAHLREDVKTCLALHEIKKEIEQEPGNDTRQRPELSRYYRDTIFDCNVKYYALRLTEYGICNTEYATRNTEYVLSS